MIHGPLPLRSALASAEPLVPGVAGTVRLADRLVWEGTFGGRFEDREYAMGVFERRNEEVRRRVPRERLPVFDVRQGWAPPCDFLGVEAPDRPFPRLNEARKTRRGLLGLVALSARRAPRRLPGALPPLCHADPAAIASLSCPETSSAIWGCTNRTPRPFVPGSE